MEMFSKTAEKNLTKFGQHEDNAVQVTTVIITANTDSAETGGDSA
jgi:hypothetical protein